jgi:hypothetical protein
MADKKISQLVDATAPLSGSEVLPVVQGGSTVKVSVSNLTAGRSVSVLSATLSGGTVNGVLYLDGSKVTSSGGSVTYDGSTFTVTGDASLATSSGSVGIGTASPSFKLHVQTNADSATGAFVRNSSTGSAASGSLLAASAVGNLILRAHSAAHGVWPNQTLIQSDSGFTNGLAILTAGANPLSFWTNSTERMQVTPDGNIVAGASAALATTATDGFLYVPTCAGTPTGVPTAITGMAPIVVDTTNNKLYFYSTGVWRDAGP